VVVVTAAIGFEAVVGVAAGAVGCSEPPHAAKVTRLTVSPARSRVDRINPLLSRCSRPPGKPRIAT